ncbi:MAG: hypothetical protein HKL85_06050 [Acidimicrobiaceae bacterium]|nr:hypothetical protein [Acidimicrobiaceae bacterium]
MKARILRTLAAMTNKAVRRCCAALPVKTTTCWVGQRLVSTVLDETVEPLDGISRGGVHFMPLVGAVLDALAILRTG